MSDKLRIPPETIRLQSMASDPARSAWVAAHAGSGKTHVLSQRVIRLLLQGTDPSRILCLTYTRAAAANMANRVFGTLARWSLMDDQELARNIEATEGRKPDGATIARARRLFARALETPGGLKIQTIHAFCEAILHQFPLEANIAGHFELLDGQMEEALIAEARRDLLGNIASGADANLADAFAEVIDRAGETGLDKLLAEVVSKREKLRRFIDRIGQPPEPYAELFEAYGFSAEETADAIAARNWPYPGFAEPDFREIMAHAEETDAKQFLKQIGETAIAAYAEKEPARRLKLFAGAMLTGKGEIYADKTFKKAMRTALPGIYERYCAAAELIQQDIDRLNQFAMLQATRSALTIADALISRYERLKQARGFLDFNDLIMRTVNLLARQDVGPWVQFKLDRGIDHVLIDEAQDTSPEQWQIVRMLTAEFFAGEGAREDVERTIFAVGDEKQSIYSFQGAEPAAFAESGMEFERQVGEAGAQFERVRLTHSFRSTYDVLSAVDTVFARDEARRGLTRDPEPLEHKAVRDNAPGYVELWQSLTPQTVEEPDDWTQAVDHTSAPAARLAELMADRICQWLKDGEVLEGKKRRLKPGDILVLVRKRDRFVHALSRSLKERNVSVAGADRLRLTAHIAVQDLLALGKFLLQPHDDLSLAAVLKSPIFSLSDDDLFRIGWKRGKSNSLYQALHRRAQQEPWLASVVETLDRWQNKAGFSPVFELYSEILTGTDRLPGMRQRFVARLGHEANDILDEFLSYCLASERSGVVGLEALLAVLGGAAPEIKREMDQARDEVRIMTVHAAKGLEAPVVFLVDPGSKAFTHSHRPELMPFMLRQRPYEEPLPAYLWRGDSSLANSLSRSIDAELAGKAEEEYRRLLYVGMTRAEDRLIVCGYRGKQASSEPTWHDMVRDAFAASQDVETRDEPTDCAPVLRYRVTPTPPFEVEQEERKDAASFELPAHFSDALERPAELPRPLSPSGAFALIEPDANSAPPQASPVLGPEQKPNRAMERGTAMHRLLQLLPDMPEEQRAAAAQRHIARTGASWSEAERKAAVESVLGILEDETFKPLFSTASRAEVSLMGEIRLAGRQRAVAGKIDRLVVQDKKVLIVDYKTNRPPPRDIGEVPKAYIAQMALYARLLQPLYPDHEICAALLFTEAPRLIEVSAEAMEEALAGLT